MPTNADTVNGYLNFALLQLGAESYLHGANLQNASEVTAAWQYGFNDPTHPFIDPDYVDPKTGKKTGRAAPGPNDGFDEDGMPLSGPNKTVLPAYNRMVAVQAARLFDRFEVIDQHADDATGFSATLFNNRATGAYTLSFRSTEFRAWETAGDNPRDDAGGNQEGIRKSGFAFAQLASMEDYWRHIRNGERWQGRPNQAGGTWVADPGGALGAFKQYMDSKPAGKGLFVTGYSLGGHLANVFTLIHEAEVEKTYVYNGGVSFDSFDAFYAAINKPRYNRRGNGQVSGGVGDDRLEGDASNDELAGGRGDDKCKCESSCWLNGKLRRREVASKC